MDRRVDEIENNIDHWLYDMLDSDLPRNVYIYHCNLAFIDYVVDSKVLFTPMEKHFLFSLTYNTHIAHKKLKEEKCFDYSFNREIYLKAYNMIIRGMQYSLLCDIFPLLHSEKASIKIMDQQISFNIKEMPKKNYKFIEDYSIRKALSYTLQMATGKIYDKNDEEIAMELSNIYMHFWNENMLYGDYEPYSRLCYGGISFFFVIAAMRRFNKLYQQDFDIVSLDSQKMMILLSPDGAKKIREYVPEKSDELYKQALDEHVYKITTDRLYPKLNVTDAPLNRTSDGYIFVNPLVILFNDSCETQFLNYVRKCDNPRYLRIKDKIKERIIPLIIEMVKYKNSTIVAIPNFHVKIPCQKKNRRECDLLLIDENGFALYVEVKHFYYPQSFCETKNLDNELKKALDKMPEQLRAITENWESIQKTYDVRTKLNGIAGVIVSHRYCGYDIPIDKNTPIVSSSTLYESIAKADGLKEIYAGCKDVDILYPNLRFVQRTIKFDFERYQFNVDIECLDPIYEIEFIKAYRKQIARGLNSNRNNEYKSISELAKAYIDEINEKI